jgi:sugar phosphate isomerase/epimerase
MISIYDWFGYELPIEKRYKLIKSAGFDAVLMWWSNGFGRDVHGLDEYLKAPQIAREQGLIVENIHAPVDNQNELWNDINCIDDCKHYGIPTIVIHLPNDDHQINALGMKRIENIVDVAERCNVNVGLENLRNMYNVGIILERVASDKLGFCYDAGHHYSYYADIDLLSKYGSRLKSIHLHDNNGKFAQHGLPFDGTINWNEVINNLSSAQYNGSIAIEAMNWEYEHLQPEDFLIKAAERAVRLSNLLI